MQQYGETPLIKFVFHKLLEASCYLHSRTYQLYVYATRKWGLRILRTLPLWHKREGPVSTSRALASRQYKELSVLRRLKGEESFFLTGGLETPTDGRHRVLADFCLFLLVLQLKNESFFEIFLVLSVLSSTSMPKQIME